VVKGEGHLPQLPLHRAVPVVLDCVVGTPLEHLRNFCPLVVDLTVHQEQDPLFFFAPAALLDFRVEMVVPTLSTLFTNTLGQVLGYHSPLLSSNSLHELYQSQIFL